MVWRDPSTVRDRSVVLTTSPERGTLRSMKIDDYVLLDDVLRAACGDDGAGIRGLARHVPDGALRVESLEATMRVRTYSPGLPDEDQPDRLVPLVDVATREVRLVTRADARAEALSAVWSRLWRGL